MSTAGAGSIGVPDLDFNMSMFSALDTKTTSRTYEGSPNEIGLCPEKVASE